MAGEGEVLKRFDIALDISRSVSNREFTVVEGDTGNELVITLTDGGAAVALTGCRVLALFSKSDGTTVSQDSGTQDNGVSIGGEANNEITVRLFPGSFSPGMVECEVQVYSGTASATLVTSAKFNFMCRRGILNEDTIEAVENYPILAALISDVNALQTAAEALAVAETAREEAEDERVLAETARDGAETARASAEGARASAETARAGAESGRAQAETARAALQTGFAQTKTECETVLAQLEAAVEALPGFAAVAGLLKCDGASNVSAAVAGTDYATPGALAVKYDKPIRASGISVAPSAFVADATYADYPYRAAVSVSGATASMIPDVAFGLTDAVSGILAPVCESFAGGVYIYASEAPAANVSIAALTLWKGV